MNRVNRTPASPNIRIFPQRQDDKQENKKDKADYNFSELIEQMQEEDNVIDISSDSETYTMHKRLPPTRFTW